MAIEAGHRGDNVAVREHHTFGLTGRARRVQQRQQIVRGRRRVLVRMSATQGQHVGEADQANVVLSESALQWRSQLLGGQRLNLHKNAQGRALAEQLQQLQAIVSSSGGERASERAEQKVK